MSLTVIPCMMKPFVAQKLTGIMAITLINEVMFSFLVILKMFVGLKVPIHGLSGDRVGNRSSI